MESKPNISNPIMSDVIGLFVTPQNTATIPTAAQRDGDNPTSVPNMHPKVAPMQKEGTISPPLNPTPKVMAVKMIFQKNAIVGASPRNASSMRLTPAPPLKLVLPMPLANVFWLTRAMCAITMMA